MNSILLLIFFKDFYINHSSWVTKPSKIIFLKNMRIVEMVN